MCGQKQEAAHTQRAQIGCEGLGAGRLRMYARWRGRRQGVRDGKRARPRQWRPKPEATQHPAPHLPSRRIQIVQRESLTNYVFEEARKWTRCAIFIGGITPPERAVRKGRESELKPRGQASDR